MAVKTAALGSLGLVSFFAELDEDEILNNLSYLLEIVSSDGSFVNAEDEPDIVAIAINTYGLLATLVDDLSADSDEAIETFLDQLSSNNSNVQVAAAECIALMYEKSYTEPEEGEKFLRSVILSDPNQDASDGVAVYEGENQYPTLVRRYFAYRHRDRLEAKLQEMATVTHRHISKKDRKVLNIKLADVRNSLHNPLQGPNYRPTLREDGSDAAANGQAIRAQVGDLTTSLVVDKWWLLVRHHTLRRFLKNREVLEHVESNPAVRDMLPVDVTHQEPTRRRQGYNMKGFKKVAGLKHMHKSTADRSMLELEGVDYYE